MDYVDVDKLKFRQGEYIVTQKSNSYFGSKVYANRINSGLVSGTLITSVIRGFGKKSGDCVKFYISSLRRVEEITKSNIENVFEFNFK